MMSIFCGAAEEISATDNPTKALPRRISAFANVPMSPTAPGGARASQEAKRPLRTATTEVQRRALRASRPHEAGPRSKIAAPADLDSKNIGNHAFHRRCDLRVRRRIGIGRRSAPLRQQDCVFVL